jgi:hypothetical protein
MHLVFDAIECDGSNIEDLPSLLERGGGPIQTGTALCATGGSVNDNLLGSIAEL